MKKGILLSLGVVGALVIGFFVLNSYIYKEKQGSVTLNHKNIVYSIEGEEVSFIDGVAQKEMVPGSASVITTQYFGNEFVTDLNGDGRDDIVFLVTQNRGGSGTFFYAVGALNMEGGYIGSDGYLLGDRIAPQNIEVSPNPRHRNVIVVNYADREEGEPMTTPPSVAKSAYLKLDTAHMQWGIVEPNFEGESR